MTTINTPEYEVIDLDGGVVGFVRDINARCVQGFVPATGGSTGHRLLHPQYAAAMNDARGVAAQEASDRVLALCADMTEPDGIRSSLA